MSALVLSLPMAAWAGAITINANPTNNVSNSTTGGLTTYSPTNTANQSTLNGTELVTQLNAGNAAVVSTDGIIVGSTQIIWNSAYSLTLEGTGFSIGSRIANAGTGGITITADGGIPGFPGISAGGTATGNGGAISTLGVVTLNAPTSSASSPITVSNVTVTGNGGAIEAGNGLIVNGAFRASSNTASNNGGAVEAKDVTVYGSTALSNNTATAGVGGAISTNGSVTLGDAGADNTIGIFSNKAGTNGGAIFTNTGSSSVTLNGKTIGLQSNTAGTSGGVIYTNGSVSLGANVADINNFVIIAANTATNGNGGAVWSAGNTTIGNRNSDVTIGEYATNVGNTADGSGGAVYGREVFLTGKTVTAIGNTATNGDGGAIYSSVGMVYVNYNNGTSTAVFNPNGVHDFSNNTAGGNGGAIYSTYRAYIGDYTDTSKTTTTLNDNSAGLSGGAVYAVEGIVILGDLTANNNSAVGQGGALYAGNNPSGIGFVYLEGGAVSMDKNSAGDSGGAIYHGGPDDFSINAAQGPGANTVSFTNNTAQLGDGGALYSSTGVIIGYVGNTETVTLTGNVAGTPSRDVVSGYGGAIWANNDVEIHGTTTLSGNTAARDGGGVWSGGDFYHYGALTANDNTAGGVDMLSALGITGQTSGNGGVAWASGSVYAPNSVSMDNNKALDNDVSDDNGIGGYGGAIYTDEKVELASVTGNVSLTNNTADVDGGAIRAGGDVLLGNVNSTLTTITGNKALGGSGGAIWSASNVTVFGTDIIGNTAAGNGGFTSVVGDFTLNATTADTIKDNTAGNLGGVIWAGGNVTLNVVGVAGSMEFSNNSQNTAATPEANAIYMDNTNGGATLGLNTGNRTITFFDPVMNNAANGLITVTKTGEFGEVIFDGTNYANASDRWSKVYGETTVQAGTFTVRNNAVYGALEAEATGAAAGDSTFTVDQNATLAGGILGEVRADKITLNGNLNIAGSATPGNGGGGFSTFKLTGNSVNFGANSRILFNTYLNDAATQLTDLLVLDIKNGSAVTGTAGIFVTNVAGLAAAGVTQGDGIKVVQTDNGTTSGAFTLANPGGFVAVGPYAYTLRYKTVGGTGEDWFLTSALVDCNTNPNDPACATPNSGDVPNYNPATSLIAAAPGLALTYGSVLLGSLHERHPTRHDQHGVDDNACGQDQLSWAECQSSAFWARGLGGVGKRNGGSAGIYGNHGPTYDYDYIVGQLGVDLLRTEDASGNRNHFGAYYAYGQIEGDVGAVNWGYAGQTGMHGNSLGLYFTHFGAEGGYIDVVAQGTRYGVNARDHITGAYINTDGTGYAASLEGGLPFWSDGDQTWGIEPQAQLTYQHININSTHEKGVLPGNNTKVSFDDVKSLQGRVGVRLAHNWKDAPDAVGSGWLRLSLTNEFLAKPKTTFSSASDPVSFEARQTGTGVELRAGFDGWFSGVALFANLGASTGLSGQGHAFDGRMGVRVPF